MFNQRAITTDTAEERVMMGEIINQMEPIILTMAAMFYLYIEKSFLWFLFALGLAIYYQFYGLKGV